MNLKDSSEEDEDEEEETHISPFSKFDETIEVRNAEEIASPVNRRPLTSKRSRKNMTNDSLNTIDIDSPRGKRDYGRFGEHSKYGKSMAISSDPSDSEETDDDDIQGTGTAKPVELYDPKQFEDLETSAEIKELFQNITRYTPQKIELNYKLIPFIPDYIPAVGDIDAFLKIPRPDGAQDKIGLIVLDEPCANQSDPAVLHLQLRSQCRSAGASRQAVIKRIDDAEKNGRLIEKWIEDIGQIQRNKHTPSVHLSKPMPDIDSLMQQWPPELEDKFNEARLDFTTLDCDLPQLVDIICNLVDIPSQKNNRLEALHTLFTLYLEIRDARVQHV